MTFIVIVLVLGPYFTILALNTLFSLNIPVTFQTWLAVFWLHWVIATRTTQKEK